MALLFIDDPSHNATATIDQKWFFVRPDARIASGKYTQASTDYLNNGWITRSLAPATQTGYIGVLHTTPAGTYPLAALTYAQLEIQSSGGVTQLSLTTDGNGIPSFRRGNGTSSGTILATGSTPWLANGATQFVEISFTIDAVNGAAQLVVDGTAILTVTGVNTRPSANYDRVIFWSAGAISDIYICDSSGSTLNSFLGKNTRVLTAYATAAGTLSQFTPLSGANYTNVDDAAPNTTDYVSATVAGKRDSYTMGDIDAASVLAVSPVISHNSTSGIKTLTPALVIGGTWYSLGALGASTGAYAYQWKLFTQNPATSLPWTVGDANLVEAAVEVTTYAGAAFRVTQVVLEFLVSQGSSPPGTNQQPPCCGDTQGGETTGGDPGSGGPPVLQPWTRQIAGGGAVDVVADIDEGEDWTTNRRSPNTWLEVTIQKQPVAEGTLQYRSAKTPYADPNAYFGGLKTGEIEDWGTIERATADWKGEFEVSTASVVLNDRNGRWRSLLGSDTTKYLTGADAVIRMISEEGRKAGNTPRRLFAGKVSTIAPQSKRQFGLQLEGRLGSRYGPYDLDKPLLKRMWGDWGSTVPVEVQKKPVPFLWGELSDAGAVDTTGANQERGMVVPTYLGEYFVGTVPGTPPTVPVYLNPPAGLTITIHGSGVTHTVACGVTARNDNGQTTLSNIVQVPNYPLNPSPAFYATWTWTNPTNGAAKAVEVYVQDGGGTPRYQLAELNNGGTWTNPETTYIDQGDVPHAPGIGTPPPARNTAQVPGGVPGSSAGSLFYGVYGLLGHAAQILRIYGSDLAPTPVYAPVQVSEIGSGLAFLVPGGPGWPLPDRWLEKNNQRWFFFLAQGAKSEAHKSGQMPFRCNLSGWDANNDTTGLVIDQGWRVYQDILTQLVIGDWDIDSGQGYWFGPRLTIPTFANDPTVPMIKSTTFEAAQEVTKKWTGDSFGYRVCVYLNDDSYTARDFIAEMDQNLGGGLCENAQGQMIAALIDDTMDVSTAPRLIQHRDILEWGDPQYADDEIEGLIHYQFDYNYSTEEYRSGDHNVRDAASIAGYGERVAEPRTYRWLRDANVAVDRVGRELLRRKNIQRLQPITLDMRGVMYDISSVVLASHKDGVGSVDGDVDTPFIVERHIPDLNRGTVTLLARDMRNILSTAFPLTLLAVANPDNNSILFSESSTGTLPMELR